MNAARLRWFALLAAMWAVSYGISHFRANMVREYVTSAQVYWRADKAVITLSTAAEVRSEGIIAKGLRIAGGWIKLKNSKLDLRAGAAHVFTLQNGRWEEQKLSPTYSPLAFSLWPYDGKFYTWDKRQKVREWDGQMLLFVAPQQVAELRKAFPNDPDNFLAAGTGESPHPYDIVQDAVTRDEWHAYQNIAALPDGKHLAFPVGDKTFELIVQRIHAANTAGEVSLTISQGGKSLPLWQAQPVARSVSGAEVVSYMNAPPLFPGSVSNPLRGLLLETGGTVLVIFLVWMVFLKPMLLNNTKMIVQYADADADDFPNLDRIRWNDYSAHIEALGFVRLRDFKMSNALTGGISRMFLHPKSNCYASVHQVFSSKAPPLGLGFFSYLGEDWTVGHGSNKPTPGNAITRTNHKLSFSRPGMSPEQLYTEHLATRDKIAHDLGLAIVTPQGFETYRERSTQATQAMRDSIRKTNPIMILLKHRRAKFTPLPNDWLGDYPKEMEARTGQKFVPSEM